MHRMKLGLNGATIMPSPIEDDIEIAADCGFGALEFWAAKLDRYAAEGSLAALAARMRELGLAPSSINSVEGITFRDEAGRGALVDELKQRVAMASALGAPSIVVVPGSRDEPVPARAAVDDSVDVLRAMSDVAGDVALAFEFLGKPGCTVPTLGMAIEIIERVDRPNVGMVLDVYHFYAGDSAPEDLRRVPIDRLLVVHLNGVENLPKDRLTDAHRLYPGEGAAPIGMILGVLRERGYDGVASVEIFRPEYWNQDPREVARTAFTRARAVLEVAGYDVESPHAS
jgi:2-keto-myo-inositol isomerase